jgi:hypothetical protein
MAEYRLTDSETVFRTNDGASIPNDLRNRDRAEYEAWLSKGNRPDPFAPPPAVEPQPSIEDRLAALEKRSAAVEAVAIEKGVFTKADVDGKADEPAKP